MQAVAPTVLLPSSRGSFARNSKSSNNTKSVVQLIDETIDGGKAVARTRVRRTGTAASRIASNPSNDDGVEAGSHANEAADLNEIFDDVDFYQQLLRDVIDSRAGREGKPTLIIQILPFTHISPFRTWRR